MHELAVAEALLGQILEIARDRTGRPVIARISCGQLNAVNPEALSFAFDVLAKGTMCQGMKIMVDIKPITMCCNGCGLTYAWDGSRDGCPGCGDSDVRLMPDPPLVLESIEFQGD